MRINGIGYDSKLTASERRILISHWVGEAWNKLCAPEYDNLRRRCWEKTKSHHLLTTAESLPTSNQLVENVDFNITEENNEDTDGTDQPDDEGES